MTTPAGRTLVMGVLNVTPDSFSDGGRYLDTDAALSHALELVAAGCSNSDIAAELFVSDTTVKSHLAHIFTKLGVSSRTAAVSRARERGILR